MYSDRFIPLSLARDWSLTFVEESIEIVTLHNLGYFLGLAIF